MRSQPRGDFRLACDGVRCLESETQENASYFNSWSRDHGAGPLGVLSNFTPYEGVQENWPVADGGLVNRKYQVPVYYGPPPRPYIVMGTLTNDDVQDAARAARKLGADAVILTNSSREYAGSNSSGTATVIGNTAFGTGATWANYNESYVVTANSLATVTCICL